MFTITDKEKQILLRYAREVITTDLTDSVLPNPPENLSQSLKEKRGCFVTIHKKGQLRGCIGTIEPTKPLISGVEDNAKNAAFRDPRFPPLRREELADIDIEISILTQPQKLDFTDGDDLKNKLKPGVHGVILSRGWQRATFLPQVWDQLPDVEVFLSHLCEKGGMDRKCWQHPETEVEVYEVEYFSE